MTVDQSNQRLVRVLPEGAGLVVPGTAPTVPSANLESSSRARSIVAACYAKPVLHIVFLHAGRSVPWELDEERCGSMHFGERDAAATKTLHMKVRKFLQDCAIDEIVLRTGVTRGPYAAHGLAFKVEAILEYELPKPLLRVQSSSVATWARKQEFAMPAPYNPDFSAAWHQGQYRTIEAGIFALAEGKIHGPAGAGN